MGNKDKNAVDQIIEEAQEEFDFRERLLGVSRREKTVTVFTDPVTGAELGGVEDILVPGTDLKSGQQRRWGVVGELDTVATRANALADDIDRGIVSAESVEDEIAELQAERERLTKKAKALSKKLHSTAITFTLHAVPEFVLRDARRQARKNLGIKQKGIEGREEEYTLEYTAILLSASVGEWTDHRDGKTRTSLSVDQAKALRDMLPPGQFPLLDSAMYDLSMEVAIARSATDDTDF